MWNTEIAERSPRSQDSEDENLPTGPTGSVAERREGRGRIRLLRPPPARLHELDELRALLDAALDGIDALARLCEQPQNGALHVETAMQLSRRMDSSPLVARAQSLIARLRLVARPSSLNTFHWEGEVWSVSFAGRTLRLRDGKGPRYLAALLAAPGSEIHVLELAGARATTTAASAPEGLTVGGPGGMLEDAPDARASREYRARVSELRAELEEAESMCDLGRAERLRSEHDLLVSQVAQRFGARVRSRGPAETARKAVTKVLRLQIDKMLKARLPLAEHLRESIRMGTFCSYEPRTPIHWDVAFPS